MRSSRVAYFDCFSGISGDMCLGALLDCGVPQRELRRAIKGLGLQGYSISIKRVNRRGFLAKKFTVRILKKEKPRKFPEIRRIIKSANLPERVKERSLRIFRRLFRAEAAVHGGRFESIHLHELSGTDCIIDIVGTIFCLHHLGVERVVSSPLELGGGMIRSSHGLLPVPAPATAELLRGIPAYSSGLDRELTTPTGAAIISEITDSWGGMPEMATSSIGYGAGSADFEDWPNLLRVFIGEERVDREADRLQQETLLLLQTNIDDMNPQVYEHLMELLFQNGALDVYLTNVLMKKNRPAVVVNVLAPLESSDRITSILLRETTTLGVRKILVERTCLRRKAIVKGTPYGPVRFKITEKGESPEYEDCKRIAREQEIPLIEVFRRLGGG
jgi:hypothetical protein